MLPASEAESGGVDAKNGGGAAKLDQLLSPPSIAFLTLITFTHTAFRNVSERCPCDPSMSGLSLDSTD